MLWGDAELWWKLAEANGLSGNEALVAGQTLIIPGGVMRSAHNASTFKPYDPGEVIDPVSPTIAPRPPKANKCAKFGVYLMVVVAVAVAAALTGPLSGAISSMLNGGTFAAGFTAGWGVGAAAGAGLGAGAAGASAMTATGLATSAIAGGALAGAAASVASQAVGLATGVQEKFSWNAVALAALNGGVGAMTGAGATMGVGGTSVGSQMLRAAVVNTMTQGVGMALGLQKEFSWASVAASAASPWISHRANLDNRIPGTDQVSHAAVVAHSSASAIVEAAARTAFEGGSFGDNLIAALPNVIGQTIGSAISDNLSGSDDYFDIGVYEDMQPLEGGPLPELAQADPLQELRMVQDGDSFWNLGGGYEGMLQWMEANPGIDPRSLRPGSFLSVPSANMAVSPETLARAAESDSEYRQYLAAEAARSQRIPGSLGVGGLNLGIAWNAAPGGTIPKGMSGLDWVQSLGMSRDHGRYARDPVMRYALQELADPRNSDPISQYLLRDLAHQSAMDIYWTEIDLPLQTPMLDPVNVAMYADLPAAGWNLLRVGGRYGLERAATGASALSSRTGQSTGVVEFDQLFAQSPRASLIVAALERRGVVVVDDVSRLEAGASVQTFREGGRLVMVYDSASSSFLDVLHDARHVAQIQRAEAQGINILGNNRLMGFAERGAYRYEMRLGQRYDFSPSYMDYARGQMAYYFPRSYATSFAKSPTLAAQARVIEPGYPR